MNGSGFFAHCAVVLTAIGFTGIGRAAEVRINARVPSATPHALPFAIGGRSPAGHAYSANSQFLTLDGNPWFPVMGEFHYSRYPADEWERELLKMKAGGITVISSYVFWLHHEQTEGKFDWSGQRDLRRFVTLCGKHGLQMWLRVGPWVHSESRNGGFPEWLVQSGIPLRQDDPRYIERVKRFYAEIARQVHGLFFRDDGPIIGVQLENEYHPPQGGIEHMRHLRQLAIDAGMVAPYYSATGWDDAAVPPTDFLPMFGGYTEQFWSGSLTELPPNQNFFFTSIRAEDNVMGDLAPKNPIYHSRYEGFPYLTAELGAGMGAAYHRRPVMTPDDSTAAAVIKLGAGVNGLGYYMFHGGTNPDGVGPQHETQAAWNGYNDLEAKSYDWQSPLGEFGQLTSTYQTLKTLHLFLHDFGSDLATMPSHLPAQMPVNLEDRATPRVVARVRGDQGFVFINNHQRNHPLPAKTDFQIALELPAGVVTLPRHPTTIPTGAYPIWPVNLNAGGVTIRYSTAQVLCTTADPATLVCFAWPGIPVEFSFGPQTKVVAASGRMVSTAEAVYVEGIQPGTDVALRVSEGKSAPLQIVVLSRDQALNLWKAPLGGKERLLLSSAGLSFDHDRVTLFTRNTSALRVGIFPPVSAKGHEVKELANDGIFQQLTLTPAAIEPVISIEAQLVHAAEATAPVKLSAAPRAVAVEPSPAAFDHGAVWRLKLPAHLPPRSYLAIDYEGDVARIYAAGRFDNDNFYKGTTWEIGLWRYTPAELAAGLELKILPLRSDAPFFLERRARPDFGRNAEIVRLNSVTVRREFETTLDIAARP
jgi:beta-galactosidase